LGHILGHAPGILNPGTGALVPGATTLFGMTLTTAIPVLGGIAAGGKVPHDHHGMRTLERIDESVAAVEDVLAARAPVASR